MSNAGTPSRLERIMFNPGQCGGSPCIRGMRVGVRTYWNCSPPECLRNRWWRSCQTLTWRMFTPALDLPLEESDIRRFRSHDAVA